MIDYQIYIAAEGDEPFYVFRSSYQYKEGHRLFVKKDGEVLACKIMTITGDLTNAEPITRLNCNVSRYNR